MSTNLDKIIGTWRLSDYTPEFRETSGVGRRPVLTPDEVLRLPVDEALVIIRGKKPLKVDKMDYSRHPEFPLIRTCKASAHIPEWRRLEAETANVSKKEVNVTKADSKQPVQKKVQKTASKQTAARVVSMDKESLMF